MTTRSEGTVAVIGGGYGGVKVAKALDDVADVTLVDPTEAFVHNIAAWRALVEPEWLERIFMPYDHLLARGRFVRDRAVAVDGRRVTLASGETLEPDHLILATGSSYPFPAKTDEPDVETARRRYRAAHDALLGAGRVLIVGAGPSGLELAGEIKAFFPAKHVTVADIAPDILPGPFDPGLRAELRRQLDALGVELVLDESFPLPDVPPAVAAPVRAGELTADIWYRAFGVAPATGFLPADWLDDAGYVRVDEHLRVQDGVYALGDIADADGNMAGRAGMQAALLAANLRTLISGEGALAPYVASPPLIAIPLGPQGGAGQLPDGVVGAEVIAELKGRALLVEHSAALFDSGPEGLGAAASPVAEPA